MIDRGCDAVDIFNATVGVGAGAKIRVGPVHFGAVYYEEMGGIRCGEVYWEPFFNDEEIHLLIGGYEEFFLPDATGGNLRGKTYSTLHGPITFSGGENFFDNSAPYYSQIDLVFGLGPSFRLGFNPGELLDFILGWFNVDIYNDDLEKQKKIEQSPAGEHLKAPPEE